MADFSQLSGIASDVGGAVSDFFAATGDEKEASSYGKAATIAQQNEQIVANSTAIQQAQASRGIYKTISGQQAGEAGAGLQMSGSAGDLLRSSASQGGLQKALIGAQGLIQEASFEEQAQSYLGMQSAAQTASKVSQGGGWLQTLGTVASIAAMF